MSLDYIFVPTKKPVMELQSILELDDEISHSIDESHRHLKSFFPGFVFEMGLGQHIREPIFCEARINSSSIHVSMKGDGDILKIIDRASVVAADNNFATLDAQSSELYCMDRAKDIDYLGWYKSVRNQYKENT